MASLKITDVQVWNQDGRNATLFFAADAISLAASVDLSPDLTANLEVRYFLRFQLIDAGTNTVTVSHWQPYQLPENWPRWWFTAGDNWGSPSDYTTADRWGLKYSLAGGGLFGFRALLTAGLVDENNVNQPFDAFDISPIHWFRIW